MSETETKKSVFAEVLEEHIASAATEQVANADELLSLIMDIQQADGVKFDECVARCLVQGAIARKRSIEYSAKTKAAKQTASNLERYNRAIAANPSAALNPKANATLMLGYNLITRAQYDKLLADLDGAAASIKTQEVSVA